jgi:hypothetical protein
MSCLQQELTVSDFFCDFFAIFFVRDKYQDIENRGLVKDSLFNKQHGQSINLKEEQRGGSIRQKIIELDERNKKMSAIVSNFGITGPSNVCSVPSNVNYSNGMMAGVVPSNEYFPPRLCKRVSAAYRDKNEIRRAVAQAKREERERQAGLIREQEVQKKEATQTLLSSVNKVEQQPTRTAKKYSSETKVTIKRHSKNKGYLEALVQVGQAKEVWLPVFVFWQPHYILSYLPEWHVYCKKKVLPDEWKYNRSKGKVMDVLETCKAQKNRFNHQWSVYCDNLGDISPGMRKGFMDRSRRITVPVVTKKRRRSG